jgi:hypothetical protein
MRLDKVLGWQLLNHSSVVCFHLVIKFPLTFSIKDIVSLFQKPLWTSKLETLRRLLGVLGFMMFTFIRHWTVPRLEPPKSMHQPQKKELPLIPSRLLKMLVVLVEMACSLPVMYQDTVQS